MARALLRLERKLCEGPMLDYLQSVDGSSVAGDAVILAVLGASTVIDSPDGQH